MRSREDLKISGEVSRSLVLSVLSGTTRVDVRCPRGHTSHFFSCWYERGTSYYSAHNGVRRRRRRGFHSLSVTSCLRLADARGNRRCASSSMSFIEATFESFTGREFARGIGGQSGIGVRAFRWKGVSRSGEKWLLLNAYSGAGQFSPSQQLLQYTPTIFPRNRTMLSYVHRSLQYNVGVNAIRQCRAI